MWLKYDKGINERMECWRAGVLEYWVSESEGIPLPQIRQFNTPPLHYSITPNG
jgi:hypothetical protein